MSSHGGSAIYAFVIAFGLMVSGQLFKEILSSSRGGTLAAGCLGGFEFLFLLTGVSNLEMNSGGSQIRAGWVEVLLCLSLATASCCMIHRVAATVCVLASAALLFLLTSIAHNTYSPIQPPVRTQKKTK